MNRYLLRLDDASHYMDIDKWSRMEAILDRYGIKPIFGLIPDNKDESMVSKYDYNPEFWNLVHSWISKGWIPAMHGLEHRYVTKDGGINPVNYKSEFAGLSYEEQAYKIKKGWNILLENEIKPKIFFAPSHTFDDNTLRALENETSIRIISDTPAWDVYKSRNFIFIPQQSGNVRTLPMKTVTFCYHPNNMKDEDFVLLEEFISKRRSNFIENVDFVTDRKKKLIDVLVMKLYFFVRRIRK